MKNSFVKDKLKVNIYPTRQEMGLAAAADIEAAIVKTVSRKGSCNMIFAAAPSQNEVLAGLAASEKVDWSAVNAFHMDEYIGLPSDAPQGFANFLRNALFDKVKFRSVNCIDSSADAKDEIKRYSELLENNPIDIVVMGIGENGHIAFNDPHVADFKDSARVKAVELDEICRTQQVHDGCFAKLDDVPKLALTLTIPMLISAKEAFCIVPASTKAAAVYNTINGEISEKCPATILRKHDNATLYLDSDSSSKL